MILAAWGRSRPREFLQPRELPNETRTPRAAGDGLGLRGRGQDLPDFAALGAFEPQDKRLAHVIAHSHRHELAATVISGRRRGRTGEVHREPVNPCGA